MADFSALHVALSGLQAARIGIDTVSHNIANVSTDGYTRQRVDLASRYPLSTTLGQLGTGVKVVDITRERDAFLDTRFRADVASAGAATVRAGLLMKAETVLAEPESGLSSELSAVWAACEDLTLNPSDTAARQNVISKLESLALRARTISDAWGELSDTESFSLSTSIIEANDLLHQVASLNAAIQEAGTGHGVPNDLMDQRDILVDELSRKLGVGSIDQGDGTIRVSLSGMALVSGVTVSELSFDFTTASVLHPSGVELTLGGEARGFQTFLRDDLPAFEAKLDQFAVDLATAMNSVHASGWVNETDPGGDLLTFDPTDPAGTLTVAITDPALIATAANPGPPFPTFDGRNAEAMAALRTGLVAVGGTDTLEGSIRTMVTELGQASASAQAASRSQASLLTASDRARLGTHGVSLDEEMVSMLEYQRMYEAASRAMTAIDEALDVLINRTGLVGR